MAETVDREAVRVLAVAVGVREAARQLGLEEDRVRQWSSRGKWFAQPELPPTMQDGGKGCRSTVTNVTKSPGLALSGAISALGDKTKLGMAKTIYRGSQAARLLPGKAVIAQAQQLKALTDTADKLHGWSKSGDSQALVQIQINPAQHIPAPVIDVEGL